jgi:hypothetical protein
MSSRILFEPAIDDRPKANLLVYSLFVRDRVLTPDRRFDKFSFRLDESVTPHAIDLFGPGEKQPVKGITVLLVTRR